MIPVLEIRKYALPVETTGVRDCIEEEIGNCAKVVAITDPFTALAKLAVYGLPLR